MGLRKILFIVLLPIFLYAQDGKLVRQGEIDSLLMTGANKDSISSLINDSTQNIVNRFVADSSIIRDSLKVQGYTDFTETSEPANPPSTVLRLWAENIGDFGQLHFKDSNGLDYQLGRDNIHTIRNTTGATLTKGTWVYLNGSNGTVPTVAKAKANSSTTMPVAGIIVADVENNSFGQMMTHGDVQGMNTSAFNDGDLLYISGSTAGEVTTTIPTGTNIVQQVGEVIKGGSVGGGIIAVFIDGMSDPGLTQTLSNKTLASPITDTLYTEAINIETTAADGELGDGDWRFVISGTTLLIQRRESSSWVTKITLNESTSFFKVAQ